MVLDEGAEHLYELRLTQIAAVVKFNWLARPFGVRVLAFGKISVAFLMLRLMGPSARWCRWFLHINIVLMFLINAISYIFTYTRYNPQGKVTRSRCWNPLV